MFKVTEKSVNTKKHENCCFYCGKRVGEVHEEDCITILQLVEISINIRFPTTVAAYMQKIAISNLLNNIDIKSFMDSLNVRNNSGPLSQYPAKVEINATAIGDPFLYEYVDKN